MKKEAKPEGRTYGILGIVFAVLSLITLPIVFGPLAVISGAIAISKKDTKLGFTAVILGVVLAVASVSLTPYAFNLGYNWGSNFNKEEYIKKTLKEEYGYEVIDVIQVYNGARITMKSLGNRDEQVWNGILTLSDAYPNAENYYVDILTPEETCSYSTFLTNYDSYKKMMSNHTALKEVDFEFGDIKIPLEPDGTLDKLIIRKVIEDINRQYNEDLALSDSAIDGITLSVVVKYQIKESESCS